jgi:hypothetical protein
MRYLSPDARATAARTFANEELSTKDAREIKKAIEFLSLTLTQGKHYQTLQEVQGYLANIQHPQFRHNEATATT